MNRSTVADRTRRVCLVVAVTAVCMNASIAQPSAAGASTAFDGQWSVTLVCDDVQERGALAKGYEFRFAAEIDHGRLRAQYGSPGTPSSLMLDGTVSQDGTLELSAKGVSGKSEYTVGRVAQGSAYAYSMKGKLDGTSGRASRRELRPCTATLVKN